MATASLRRATRACRLAVTLSLWVVCGLWALPAAAQPGTPPSAAAPAPLVITPWPVSDPYANVLRYYPGLTFKQGEAPIHYEDALPSVPDEGSMALGFGLEGRQGPSRAWQMLANLSPSPFSPSFDPHFELHGYLLPQASWGLDGNLSTDIHGAVTTELATSWLCPPETWTTRFFRQARLAMGRRALDDLGNGYGYGQLTFFRDDPALFTSSSATAFSTLGGGWRGTLDAYYGQPIVPRLRLRADGSVGTSGGPLPAGDRLGAGLLSQDWQTAATRASARVGLVAPLVQGIAYGWAPVATLRQIEVGTYVEGGRLWGADGPPGDGFLAGTGAELVLVSDTGLGFPLALSLGYALPVWRQDGPCAPWPGHLYVGTTVASFPVQAAPTPAN